MIRVLLSPAIALGAVALLGGCALLSSPDPVQLYRFGGDATVVNPAAATSRIQVQLRRIEFPEAAKGDKVLGVTGTEAAYIKGARWVTPAEELYGDSVGASFSAQSTRVRMIGQRELTPATRLLDIDVQAFEARYEYAEGIPTIVVSARVRMLRFPERTIAAEQTFTVTQAAAANRVSSIVEAFDIATRDLNTQIVGWTDMAVDVG